MDFEIPAEITATLAAIDAFIEREIRPLEQVDDNIRFFDHRREYARTDFEAGGVPRADWEELLREMRRRADAAGWLRWALPAEYGGHDAGQPRDGDHPRAPRGQGTRAAQRPAERELDHRQLPHRADDARLRHPANSARSGCPASSTAPAASRSV